MSPEEDGVSSDRKGPERRVPKRETEVNERSQKREQNVFRFHAKNTKPKIRKKGLGRRLSCGP